ncbi:sedoheptulose 7-phosphate cyclase [Nocardia sp. NPDC050435]|uniref:sedoheptulose 7-phosphate cyclase n=1 Tax=Nocardia sp. NPDC050435 TaxID=3155040 RepID=UPI0033FD30C0
MATSTWDVTATLPVSYRIISTRDCLHPDNPDLSSAIGDGRRNALVICDSTVLARFGPAIRAYFRDCAHHFAMLGLHMGESRKSAETVDRIISEIDRFGLSRRRDAVVAIGGGTLTDVVGYACSIYRRGVPYLRVPTTLLGMVDAAVGVKTGINVGDRKNRVGSYHPADTLIDPVFLDTLPTRHVRNGMAEIIKIGLVKDAALVERISRTWTEPKVFVSDPDIHEPIISAAITALLGELEPNLWEHNLQRLADFGHTFSPAFELAANRPRLLHGEAVTIDIALSCVLARDRGMLNDRTCARILGLLLRVGLPLWHSGIDDSILAAGLDDSIRHRDGAQNIPLLTDIGAAVFAQDIRPKELAVAAEELARTSTPEGR